VNRVLLTGRLTRDPEIRSLASGKTVTQSIVKVYRARRASMYKGRVHGYAVTNPRPARWPLVR
jgi:single-stranded DNA-binding protein